MAATDPEQAISVTDTDWASLPSGVIGAQGTLIQVRSGVPIEFSLHATEYESTGEGFLLGVGQMLVLGGIAAGNAFRYRCTSAVTTVLMAGLRE